MAIQDSAIKSELARVRELKRNSEATIELLRSDMENGKIHLRVNADLEFRKAVAESIVDKANPGYHEQHHMFADPVEGKLYRKDRQALWNPWPDSIGWRIVSVDDLVRQDGNDFDPSVDWDIVDFPYREMAIAYLEAEKEALEDNGDIPEWVNRSEVITWAFDDERFSERLIEIEETAYLEAVSFAKSEILDEIVVEVFYDA